MMANDTPMGLQVSQAGVASIRLLVVADKITATQYISFLLPFLPLIDCRQAAVALVNCSKFPSPLEKIYKDFDPTHLILSRCSQLSAEVLLKRAARDGIASIYHIDDDLLNVPPSIGAEKSGAYNNSERQQALRHLMTAAGLIYASTAPLKAALSGLRGNEKIVSGTIYCAVDPDTLPQPMVSASPIIGYMGTASHFNDLVMILPAIERLMDEHPILRFELFGSIQMPDQLARFGNRVMRHEADLNYAGFIHKLQSLGWWIGLAPLEDNDFNRCKADTKWVEYSSAGMAVVASDLPVYHRAAADGAGLLVAEGGDWYGAIRGLLVNGAKRREMIARARARLETDYTLDALRAQVLEVLAVAKARAGTSA